MGVRLAHNKVIFNVLSAINISMCFHQCGLSFVPGFKGFDFELLDKIDQFDGQKSGIYSAVCIDSGTETVPATIRQPVKPPRG